MVVRYCLNDNQDVEIDLDELSDLSGGGGKTGDNSKKYILVNSYSLSGQRFYENQTTLRQARETANGVCRAFGVTPALNFEIKGRSISYYEWECKRKGTSWKEHIRNVLDGIILPKKNKPEIAVMNKEQQLRLEKYLDKHPSVTSVGISISMYMGLRIGEVCALQWNDIDLEKRTLTVSKTIQRVQCRTGSKHTKLIITEPKSESSKHTIPIPDCLLPLLKQFRDNGEVYVVSGKQKPVEWYFDHLNIIFTSSPMAF